MTALDHTLAQYKALQARCSQEIECSTNPDRIAKLADKAATCERMIIELRQRHALMSLTKR
jgi:hypothetical protein